MSGADGVLLGLILLAVVLALRAVRQGRTGGCTGDCARGRRDCQPQKE